MQELLNIFDHEIFTPISANSDYFAGFNQL